MATFVLVHGAWHGAWCWERLVPELEARGHEAIAVELPSDDPAASFDTYADVVAAAIEGASAPVVLVGHSLGGQTVPLVPSRRAIDHLVYLCALPPLIGSSFREQSNLEPDMLRTGYERGLREVEGVGREWADLALAKEVMYGDCDKDAARAALERLRPQAVSPYLKPTSLTEYPDVPTTYILCTGDHLVQPAWSERIAKEWLDADLIRLPGGHSPYVSRPADLADVLDRLA